MRGWSLTIVIVAVLSAGCVGSSSETISTSRTSSQSGGGSGPNVDASVAEAAPDVQSEAPAKDEPLPLAVPIHLEGSIPTFLEACVFDVPVGCVQLPPNAEYNNRLILDLQGNASAFQVVVTWTASSPTTQIMSVSFHSRGEDGANLVEHGRAEGASPLTLTIADPFTLPAGMTHRIGVGVPYHYPPAVVDNTGVGTEQDFVLDGAITILAPAVPPP